MERLVQIFLVFLLSGFVILSPAVAQTTQITYQGKLENSSLPASGNFDFEFLLFDAPLGGTQIGATLSRSGVAVTDGFFAVNLDFGQEFPGANRFLAIRVRAAGAGEFTQLTPRQAVTSSPYSLKSRAAETSAVANNALQLGGVAASQYVLTNDPRMDDDRDPKPGSLNYIQNSINQQPASDFHIGGLGTANIFNARSQYNLGGTPFMKADALGNSFVGFDAGADNANGAFNSFFGDRAGRRNTTGSSNSFFGQRAGESNTTASDNSFFGLTAGGSNTTGGSNSFFGRTAGNLNTTGSFNSFFGRDTGFRNTTGDSNSFFGSHAGFENTTGISNSFFGRDSGVANTTGGENSFFGRDSGRTNTIGHSNSFFGRGTGFANTTGANNSFFGRAAGASNTTGGSNSFFGRDAGLFNTTGGSNSFFGRESGNANTTGSRNSFFGDNSGFSNTDGFNNAFFGVAAGRSNTTGFENAFFGRNAGLSNTTGSFNAFFGTGAGRDTTTGNSNSFFGISAGESNTTGETNALFGVASGRTNTTGNQNAFFGASSGNLNTTGTGNTFIGHFAGQFNTTGGRNTVIGAGASVATGNLEWATAIGADARVSTSATIVLGRIDGLDLVLIPGVLRVNTLAPVSGGTDLCRNGSNQITLCGSSQRYKSGIQTFTGGLDIVSRLRPVTFDWKNAGARDLGFVAEDVAVVEPLLTTFTEKGEIDGVKYKQITTVLVNAVNEQQKQIEELKKQLEFFKAALCESNTKAAVCTQ